MHKTTFNLAVSQQTYGRIHLKKKIHIDPQILQIYEYLETELETRTIDGWTDI